MKVMKEDLSNIFIAYKKYLRMQNYSESIKFESDESIMDFLLTNINNPQCFFCCIKDDKKVLAFMMVFVLETPFLKIKKRFWLDSFWKDKSFRLSEFTKHSKLFLEDIAKTVGAKTIEGLVLDGRRDLEKFYRRFGGYKRGEFLACDLN